MLTGTPATIVAKSVTVIQVEAAQVVLRGLALAAVQRYGHAGYSLQHVGRPLNRPVLELPCGDDAGDQVPSRAIDSGTLPRFGAVDPTTGGDTGRYAASAEWQRTSSASRNRLTGYAVAYDLDLFSNFTYFLDNPLEGDQFHQADRRLVSGLRSSHERVALRGERPIEYRLGVQVRRDDIGASVSTARAHGNACRPSARMP